MKNSAVHSEIFTTSDYSIFSSHELNRAVKKTGVLVDSMRKHGFLASHPIHCIRCKSSGQLIIKDGHHRLAAAKALGIPVLYVVCDDNATIQELQKAMRPWTLEDYCASYASLGKASYQLIMEQHEIYGIPVKCVASLLRGWQASSSAAGFLDSVKNGTFEHTEHGINLLKNVAYVTRKARNCGFQSATTAPFVNAVSMLCMVPDFDCKELVRKIEDYRSKCFHCSSTREYLQMIEDLYNYKSRSGIKRWKNLAEDAAKARSVRAKNKPAVPNCEQDHDEVLA